MFSLKHTLKKQSSWSTYVCQLTHMKWLRKVSLSICFHWIHWILKHMFVNILSHMSSSGSLFHCLCEVIDWIDQLMHMCVLIFTLKVELLFFFCVIFFSSTNMWSKVWRNSFKRLVLIVLRMWNKWIDILSFYRVWKMPRGSSSVLNM